LESELIKKEQEMKNVDIITDVLCDKCNQSCKTWADLQHTCPLYEYADLKASWGYGSTRDGEHYEYHLCQKCWENIIKEFQGVNHV
jgi:hypothetical protein